MRIKRPGMLLIGSAGKNTGKTELACSIIEIFSPSVDIVGVKVTTIRNQEGLCPRRRLLPNQTVPVTL